MEVRIVDAQVEEDVGEATTVRVAGEMLMEVLGIGAQGRVSSLLVEVVADFLEVFLLLLEVVADEDYGSLRGGGAFGDVGGGVLGEDGFDGAEEVFVGDELARARYIGWLLNSIGRDVGMGKT